MQGKSGHADKGNKDRKEEGMRSRDKGTQESWKGDGCKDRRE